MEIRYDGKKEKIAKLLAKFMLNRFCNFPVWTKKIQICLSLWPGFEKNDPSCLDLRSCELKMTRYHEIIIHIYQQNLI